MLNIIKNAENTTLTLTLNGRLDTVTAPQLESELQASLDGVSRLVLDFADLEYVSSAGLRVLLSAQKKMNAQGSMKITNVQTAVMEILDVTGFSDILTIE